MKKPERIKLITTPKTIKELNENIGNLNYNRAIDNYETWLKEAMSVDKIQKIMYKTEDDYELGETNSLHIAIAKEIHKLIGK